jgi:hypothetical protein
MKHAIGLSASSAVRAPKGHDHDLGLSVDPDSGEEAMSEFRHRNKRDKSWDLELASRSVRVFAKTPHLATPF